MNLSMISNFATLTCVAATVACGSGLSGSSDKPSVLATIQGTVVGSQSASGPSDLAVAFDWGRPVKGAIELTATSTPLSPMFPAAFSLDLTELPPEAQMVDLAAFACQGNAPCDSPNPAPTGVHVALGVVVVYEDSNHNGQLDFVAPGAPAYVDEAVGTSRPYEIIYLDKPVPPEYSTVLSVGDDGSTPQVGYNLLAEHENDCIASGDGGSGYCHASLFWRPISTPITLQMVSGSPQDQANANAFMCTSYPDTTVSVADTGVSPSPVESVTAFGPLPSSEDPRLTCVSTTSFQYLEGCTTTSPGICEGTTTECTSRVTVNLDPGASPRSDWPCTAHSSF